MRPTCSLRWGDLQGAITGHLAQTSLHRGGAESKAPNLAVWGVTAPVTTRVPTLTQPVSSTGLVAYTLYRALSGLTGTVLAQLRAGYTSAASGAQRYPGLVGGPCAGGQAQDL